MNAARTSATSGNPAERPFLPGVVRFYLAKADGTYQRQYDRIVIKRKGS